MDCRVIKDNMLDYVADTIAADLKAEINGHLKNCESCYSYYELVRNFERMINAEKAISVNPFIYTRIEEKLKATKDSVFGFRRALVRNYYYYAAVIVISLAIGVFTGTQVGSLLGKNTTPPVITSETEQLKQDFYLNEIEKDDVSQLLNNQ